MDRSMTIIMPAFKEAANLENAVRETESALAKSGITDYEILIMTCVDREGKHDGTPDIADRLAAEKPGRVRHAHSQTFIGLGDQYRKAVGLASKTYVMMVPGDNENDSSSMPNILSHLGESDMIVTYTANPEVRAWYRRFLSRWYTRILNLLFGHKMPYYNGINVYRTEDLRRALPTTDSFAFMAEILLRLLKMGRTYVTVPVHVRPINGPSSALRWKNIVSTCKTVFRLRKTL